MLLFKTIVLIMLSLVVALSVAVFIYRKIMRLPLFWRNAGMITFFVYTCHHFGVRWLTIALLHLSVCAFNFILRAWFPVSKRNRGGGYRTSSWFTGYINSSYNSAYSNYPLGQLAEEEQLNEVKFNKLVLCAFVPLWSIYSLSKTAVKTSFHIGGLCYRSLFGVKNDMSTDLKNIKAA